MFERSKDQAEEKLLRWHVEHLNRRGDELDRGINALLIVLGLLLTALATLAAHDPRAPACLLLLTAAALLLALLALLWPALLRTAHDEDEVLLPKSFRDAASTDAELLAQLRKRSSRVAQYLTTRRRFVNVAVALTLAGAMGIFLNFVFLAATR